MRLDRTPVLPFLDDDGAVRPARVVEQRDGRALIMVTRDTGATTCRLTEGGPPSTLTTSPAANGP